MCSDGDFDGNAQVSFSTPKECDRFLAEFGSTQPMVMTHDTPLTMAGETEISRSSGFDPSEDELFPWDPEIGFVRDNRTVSEHTEELISEPQRKIVKTIVKGKQKQKKKQSDEEERKFGCPTCSRRYKENWRLNFHLVRSHQIHDKTDLRKTTRPQPFHCPECPRKFSEKFRLNGHIKEKHCQSNTYNVQ